MQCANCGKKIDPVENRFVVCDCGNTEIIEDENKTSYISHISDMVIKAHNPETQNVISVNTDEPQKILNLLYQKPIIRSAKIKKEFIEKYPDDNDFLINLKPWAVISHHFHFDNSEVYRQIYKMKLYGTALEIINSCTLITDEDKYDSVDKLNNIYNVLKPGQSLYALKTLLCGFNEDIAILFSNSLFEPFDFANIINRTGFKEEDILKWIKELYDDGYLGLSIAESIIKVHALIKKLIDDFDFDLKYILDDPASPPIGLTIYRLESLLRRSKLSHKDKIFKLGKAYERNKNDKIVLLTIVNKNIKLEPMNYLDAIMYAHLVPEGSQKTIPYRIYKDKKECGFLFVGDYPFIAGSDDDDIKSAVNDFLDKGVYRY